MPRRLVALILAVVAALAGSAAVSAERPDDAPTPIGERSTVTPLLSARRVPGLLAAPVADRHLRTALDEVLATQPGTACLTVAASGRAVYARDADTTLVPASVEKLLTATVALEVLGPDHRFRTTVAAAAVPVDGVVDGDLWLVGGGDAILSTATYAARFRNQPQITTSAEELADAVVAAGIRHVTGSIRGDESRYDTDRYPDAWPQRFIDQDLSGPLSALTLNDDWASFPPAFDVASPPLTPPDDPVAQAATALTELLRARGVVIDGDAASGPAPAGAVELAGVDSAPLTEVLVQMLRESDNQTAELLLKELAVASGRPGTTVDGAAVVAAVLHDLGLPIDGLVVSDGSGLSGDNRQSCTTIQAVLERAGPDSAIADALALAGVNGTLAQRFLDSPVTGRLLAKTGTLNQVTALAGYLDTQPGARLTFTYIVNLLEPDRVDEPDLAIQDALAAALAAYPEGPSLDDLDPLPVPP